jgi:hypothetical protein
MGHRKGRHRQADSRLVADIVRGPFRERQRGCDIHFDSGFFELIAAGQCDFAAIFQAVNTEGDRFIFAFRCFQFQCNFTGIDSGCNVFKTEIHPILLEQNVSAFL